MSDPALPLSSSLQLIVSSIQSQMDELVQQKSDVGREMRNLRRRLRLLRQEQHASLSLQYRARRRKGSKRRNPGKTRATQGPSTELWRACRIALMEAEKPVSTEEIHLRITRRESYAFLAGEDPVRTIARMLSAMADAGEVQRVKADLSERCAWTLAENASE